MTQCAFRCAEAVVCPNMSSWQLCWISWRSFLMLTDSLGSRSLRFVSPLRPKKKKKKCYSWHRITFRSPHSLACACASNPSFPVTLQSLKLVNGYGDGSDGLCSYFLVSRLSAPDRGNNTTQCSSFFLHVLQLNNSQWITWYWHYRQRVKSNNSSRRWTLRPGLIITHGFLSLLSREDALLASSNVLEIRHRSPFTLLSLSSAIACTYSYWHYALTAENKHTDVVQQACEPRGSCGRGGRRNTADPSAVKKKKKKTCPVSGATYLALVRFQKTA